MQLAPIATTPRPLPLDAPLATVSFATPAGETVRTQAFPGIAGYEDPETQFVPVASYDEGVEVAQGFATDVEGYPAQGIIQATDGAWYVTRLQQAPDHAGSINIDGENYEDGGFTGFSIARHTAALQAVVGGEQVVDLRSAPVVTPGGKVLVTNERGEVIGAQG